MSEPTAAGLPPKLFQRLAEVIPADRLAGVVASFSAAKRPAFRVNTLRARDEQVLAELHERGIGAEPVDGLPHVYHVEPHNRDALVRCPVATQGRLYVQNLSSLLAAPALAVEPGMAVLDLAAAPGGKTLHLACLMNDAGTLSAFDSSRGRFYRLRNNLRLHGVTCCRAQLRDGRTVGRRCRERFDRVLLDAPCSGESRLRAAGGARLPNWSEHKIRQCAGKQRALLTSAIEACRPGGVVLYCTCSTAPEENEAVVTDVLERAGDRLDVEPVPLPPSAAAAAMPGLRSWRGRDFRAELARAVRILPDTWFDAFFLCRLRKH